MKVIRFEPTPNPNALKCVLDRAIAPRPRSYRAAPSPDDDPIAARLFAIEGVTNLLLLNDWLTVGRAPGTPWGPIKKSIERALSAMPSTDAGAPGPIAPGPIAPE